MNRQTKTLWLWAILSMTIMMRIFAWKFLVIVNILISRRGKRR